MGKNPGVAGSQTDRACATCPKVALRSCDVNTLEVTAKTSWGSERKLLAPKRMPRPLTSAEKASHPETVHKSLRAYDIVMDVTAGYVDRYFIDPNKKLTVADLSAIATFPHEAGECPNGKHPLLWAKPVSGAATRLKPGSDDTQRIPWNGDEIRESAAQLRWPPAGEDRHFLAAPLLKDGVTKSNEFTFFLRLLMALVDKEDPRKIQIVADSCALRWDGEQTRGTLRALVRLYREGNLKIIYKFKGPGRGQHTEPIDPSKVKDAPKEVKGAAQAFNQEQGRQLSVAQAAPAAPKETTQKAPAHRGFVSPVRAAKRNKPGCSIAVQLDDKDLPLDPSKRPHLAQMMQQVRAKGLEKLLPDLPGGKATLGFYLAVKWVLSFGGLQHKLTAMLTALRNCVKLGLWLDFDFSWFDGVITFENKSKPGPTYPRYASIVSGWAFHLNLNLLKLSFALKFGVKAKFGSFADVWAFVSIRLDMVVNLKGDVSLDSEKPGSSVWKIHAHDTLAVGASGGADVLGCKVTVNAEAKASLQLEGSLRIGNDDKPPKFSIKAMISPVILDYHAKVHCPCLPKLDEPGQWGPWGSKKHELWKGDVTLA